jgi:XisH protein
MLQWKNVTIGVSSLAARASTGLNLMKTKDIYHDTVKRALQKDGWTITHDPFPLQIGKKRLSADLGAERLLTAERGLQRIVVEVKSFVGQSDVKDLEQALGQYVLYRQILNEMGVERSLYLAVSKPTFNIVQNNTCVTKLRRIGDDSSSLIIVV